jgi:hypothetical protein
MCRGVEAVSRPCVEPCVEPDVEDVEARAQEQQQTPPPRLPFPFITSHSSLLKYFTWFRAGFALVSRWFRAGFALVSRRFRAGFAPVSRWFRAGFAQVSRWFRAVSRGFAQFCRCATTRYREVSRGIALLSRGIARHTLRYTPATLDLAWTHDRVDMSNPARGAERSYVESGSQNVQRESENPYFHTFVTQ